MAYPNPNDAKLALDVYLDEKKRQHRCRPPLFNISEGDGDEISASAVSLPHKKCNKCRIRHWLDDEWES